MESFAGEWNHPWQLDRNSIAIGQESWPGNWPENRAGIFGRKIRPEHLAGKLAMLLLAPVKLAAQALGPANIKSPSNPRRPGANPHQIPGAVRLNFEWKVSPGNGTYRQGMESSAAVRPEFDCNWIGKLAGKLAGKSGRNIWPEN